MLVGVSRLNFDCPVSMQPLATSHIAIAAESCQPWALPVPANGQRDCFQGTDGARTCNLTCDSGFRFPLNTSALTYSCTPGEHFYNDIFGFLNETTAPSCVCKWSPGEQIWPLIKHSLRRVAMLAHVAICT